MLMDDYITHILESKLEKEDEKIYYSRIQEMNKGRAICTMWLHYIT